MVYSVRFPLSETKTGKVNYEKLKIEMSLSTVPFSNIEGIKGQISVDLKELMSESQKANLKSVINNHDGAPPIAFDENLVKIRENVILRMNQMGIYHPLIDSDTMVRYLTKIDNALNGWRRSANPIAVLEVLYEDAGVSDLEGTVALKDDGVTPVDVAELPFHSFLNTPSNPVTGSKVFKFIASQILEASQV